MNLMLVYYKGRDDHNFNYVNHLKSDTLELKNIILSPIA
jgi:hypothetical protein